MGCISMQAELIRSHYFTLGRLHFHLNLLLASPEAINKAAKCVILHDANCSTDDKKKKISKEVMGGIA